jgi:hypothetical protein
MPETNNGRTDGEVFPKYHDENNKRPAQDTALRMMTRARGVFLAERWLWITDGLSHRPRREYRFF